MTRHVESESTRNDALSIGVLTRLMSVQSTTARPELSLYRVRGMAEAYQLASIAFDIRRDRQLVVMSPPRHGWYIDPVDVALTVGDHADVAMLEDTQTVFDVAEAITRQLAPFSGVIRILRPDLTEPDGSPHHRGRNPLVKLGDDCGSPAACLQQIERIVADGVRLPRRFTDQPLSIDDIQAAVQEAVRKERDKTKEANTKLAAVKRGLEKANAALAEEEAPVFADPHAQFRRDLHNAWLKATQEGDRPQWWPREWELGEKFLDSIDKQQIVDRRRVIRACVDVITGRHKEIKSRASHKLRSSMAGNSADVIREDGAVAWRCSVNMGPAAARLMWWERPDEVKELWVVASHDDIPTP